MLTYLFDYLDTHFDFPGAGVFQYISFRAAMAIVTSLLISMVIGKRIISFLQIKQIGETVRQLGLHGEDLKKGTPTMGGIIILSAILIPVLLFADLGNVYIQMLLITTVWMGAIGFLDDYIKVFKKNKEGLRGKFKVAGQIGLGIIVGSMLYFHPDVTIKQEAQTMHAATEFHGENFKATPAFTDPEKSTKTTIPFFKNNEFDYSRLITWISEDLAEYSWLVFIPIVIFIITAVSNGANLTDGLDGLATGTSAIVATALAVLAYVSGSVIFADYLNIMYIPLSGEMVIFAAAFIGACIGFLWYNSYPAQVFMGDTGSLAIGAIIAVFAIAVRKELLIPILCGVFLVENLSVILQVSYFKFTKKKYGEGRRIFLMSPLHHHYQKKGYHEAKIVNRFWIVSIMLAVLAIITLKLR
ncbi:phospho-N-acetylmuramoyl-pentapeptide-transferase [Phaeocystidibacter marisrubri]|uniref:Phospho-N-acetylmuramoyl-pentapeptide-transferase n=1 Tax=Phaeocystidibacter marisrubri TaxID=1577780 RepID=A0A6L3ZFM6_9FLAO|nr:phospho-N-acetylmuramoyl-pentapeptide-transferase [Phaeocystidibacter marisrubri]KAB2816836.1 phospho-N-acetylmuramoyl-pentapeptide-transferase [Phaeocystidibacter marisrubri]GGH77941.1 phospho-N-acetylmuramoyl-pentapeptide-transferase [Phaeocystidibacter marisrubri]